MVRTLQLEDLFVSPPSYFFIFIPLFIILVIHFIISFESRRLICWGSLVCPRGFPQLNLANQTPLTSVSVSVCPARSR